MQTESEPHTLRTRRYHYDPQRSLMVNTLLKGQPASLDPDVEHCRQAGHRCTYASDFPTALQWYSRAIKQAPTLGLLYANRSVPHFMLKQYSLCLQDCNTSITLAPSAAVFARRARCYEALHRLGEAVRDFEISYRMEPSPEVQQEIQRTKSALQEHAGPPEDLSHFYAILEIPPTSTEAVVRKAYRRQCLHWHPDKWAAATPEKQQNAEKMFKMVTLAFTTITRSTHPV
eukprot:NODE_4060_length_848_cov_16.589459_g3903_i0.p1 GENE.NODE_4060_length_848_cov_16.589459_g3903_i0~~NODE_4060_length_848_cov_16.589459_g3903_i0.p1  ORF type:complete len:230 (+),score=39.54 NODE_4060_length_848_cov_16.589459_g3903_i0:89-778(+)